MPFLVLKSICKWAIDTSRSPSINEEYQRALLDFAKAAVNLMKFH